MDLHIMVWFEESLFLLQHSCQGHKHMKTWIQPTLYEQFRLKVMGDIFWPTLGS